MTRVFCSFHNQPWWICRLAAGLIAAPLGAAEILSQADLQQVYTQAAARAQEVSPQSVIAVVDRDGRALLVLRADGTTNITPTERAIAVSKAGTAVFLSGNEYAFSTRTAGFIIQPHFPPGVLHRSPGPLYGVGLSSLAYSDVNYFRELDGSRIPGTRLYGSPGGLPLYKNGVLLAGIGATGDSTEAEDASIVGPDIDEDVALAGQVGFAPAEEILGSHVLIDGIRLAYIANKAHLAAHPPAAPTVTIATPPPPVVWPTAVFADVRGEMRSPLRGDPLPGLINGQRRLTADEVRRIITQATARALVTRAAIRLPAGRQAQFFITVVNNPNQPGQPAAELGTFRTPDTAIFSWDVAVQKARTIVFFSSNTRAYSARTIAFLSQPFYPPGIDGQPPGPFFGLQDRFSAPLLSGTDAPNPNLPNGITLFPGGFPLYRNGVLIGAIAVSGDGIDQDDLVAAAGTVGFQPSPAIRADNFAYRDARLPYAKFPRDPELRSPVISSPRGFENLAATTPTPGDLADLSVRGSIAEGQPLTLDFVTDDASENPRTLRLQGVRPAATDVDRETPAKLSLRLFTGDGGLIAAATASDRDTSVALSEDSDSAPPEPSSPDPIIKTALPPGAYSMTLESANNQPGVAMGEINDTTDRSQPGALKSFSIHGHTDSSDDVLSAGFAITNGGKRTVLICADAPSQPDGPNGNVTASAPALRMRLINAAGQFVAEGAPWDYGSNADEVADAAAALGKTPPENGSSTVLLVSLEPGSYTVQVGTPAGTTSTVNASIHAVPAP
jgi:uncharacterized protein GlcG (DUF336 family)